MISKIKPIVEDSNKIYRVANSQIYYYPHNQIIYIGRNQPIIDLFSSEMVLLHALNLNFPKLGLTEDVLTKLKRKSRKEMMKKSLET